MQTIKVDPLSEILPHETVIHVGSGHPGAITRTGFSSPIRKPIYYFQDSMTDETDDDRSGWYFVNELREIVR